MLKKIQGIIVKAVKYSETSVICDAYTNELGLRTYIINGVRKKNSKISPALVQPMSLVEMVVYHHEEKEINRIKEIKPSYVYQKVPFDVARGAIGLFMTEVAQKTVREPEANPILFEFLQNCYELLDQTTTPIANFPIWFLVQFSTHLGLYPAVTNLDKESVFDYSEGRILPQAPSHHHYFFSPHHTHLLAAFLQLDFEASSRLELEGGDRRHFLNNMLRYYQYHIENFGELNSIMVLQAVFS
ncbi:DNA repair protein RecO [Aureispira anguillae]|uniref:DNA repair protein RecO n=1 Tax=Aureispira anguillae TaxID=2864201 RepID=A0A916DWD5_9BACT|nr:DNA repair protein RecO [Aureispira anguillae]BDS14682.1 DNA repair protein RecO [Aureispira anguillae]